MLVFIVQWNRMIQSTIGTLDRHCFSIWFIYMGFLHRFIPNDLKATVWLSDVEVNRRRPLWDSHQKGSVIVLTLSTFLLFGMYVSSLWRIMCPFPKMKASVSDIIENICIRSYWKHLYQILLKTSVSDLIENICIISY